MIDYNVNYLFQFARNTSILSFSPTTSKMRIGDEVEDDLMIC